MESPPRRRSRSPDLVDLPDKKQAEPEVKVETKFEGKEGKEADKGVEKDKGVEPEFLFPVTTSQFLANLLKQGRRSDVVFLVGPSRQPIYAHRLVLAAHSAIFDAMLYQQPAESPYKLAPMPRLKPPGPPTAPPDCSTSSAAGEAKEQGKEGKEVEKTAGQQEVEAHAAKEEDKSAVKLATEPLALPSGGQGGHGGQGKESGARKESGKKVVRRVVKVVKRTGGGTTTTTTTSRTTKPASTSNKSGSLAPSATAKPSHSAKAASAPRSHSNKGAAPSAPSASPKPAGPTIIKRVKKPDGPLEVVIPDVEPRAFAAMLRCIYTDQVEVNSENMYELVAVAKKYHIDKMITSCSKFLESDLRVENACTTFEIAPKLLGDPDFGLGFIRENTEDILLTKAFLSLSAERLWRILQDDLLEVDEVDLLKALLAWGKAECKRQSRPENAEHVRAVCARLLPEMRFLSMELTDVAAHLGPSGLLTEEEMVDLYHYTSLNDPVFTEKEERKKKNLDKAEEEKKAKERKAKEEEKEKEKEKKEDPSSEGKDEAKDEAKDKGKGKDKEEEEDGPSAKPKSLLKFNPKSREGAFVAKDSTLLVRKHKKELYRLFEMTSGKLELELLYRGSRDGFTAAAFHAKCDNKGKTLTVVKAVGSNNIFGGYSQNSWTSAGSYTTCPSWLFSLVNTHGVAMKLLPSATSSHVYCNSSYGPTFGGGHDLHINNTMKSNSNYSSPNTFKTVAPGYPSTPVFDNTLLAGMANFTVDEIEIFLVKTKSTSTSTSTS